MFYRFYIKEKILLIKPITYEEMTDDELDRQYEELKRQREERRKRRKEKDFEM